MGKKVTYLLGAGASANAVPVLSQFNEHLDVFKYYLRSIDVTESKVDAVLFKRNIDEIIGIVENIKENYSPDTLARKYFIRQEID